MAASAWDGIVEDWRLYLAFSFSEDTLRSYTNALTHFTEWCARQGLAVVAQKDDDRREVDERDAGRWFASELRRIARNTTVNKMLAVRNFYKWLAREGHHLGDPTANLPSGRTKGDPYPAYSEAELKRLLAAAERGDYPLAHADRDIALLLTFIDTGGRRKELLRLQVGDVDWEVGELLIKHGKGAKARRSRPGEHTMQALRKYVGGRTDGPLFLNAYGRELKPPRFYELLRSIAKSAGVAGAHPHRFRTTLAVHMDDDGMSTAQLQKVMGHANPTTTLRYVGHARVTRALNEQRRRSQGDRLVNKVAGLLDRIAIGGPLPRLGELRHLIGPGTPADTLALERLEAEERRAQRLA